MDKLEAHLMLKNYAHIFTIKDPSIVANYFKSVLKYMQEPLCTYQAYSQFKKICEYF